MSGHTPGPWTACVGDAAELRQKGERVCFPHVWVGPGRNLGSRLLVNAGGGSLEEHDANARLIAAAPTMLEALKNLLQNGCTCALNEPQQGLCESCAQAREAIAKVEGR